MFRYLWFRDFNKAYAFTHIFHCKYDVQLLPPIKPKLTLLWKIASSLFNNSLGVSDCLSLSLLRTIMRSHIDARIIPWSFRAKMILLQTSAVVSNCHPASPKIIMVDHKFCLYEWYLVSWVSTKEIIVMIIPNAVLTCYYHWSYTENYLNHYFNASIENHF